MPSLSVSPNISPRRGVRSALKKSGRLTRLKCPHCKAEMKIISFISEPKLVRKILEHLKLWVTASISERAPPAKADPLPDHDPNSTAEISYELIDDGWPQYEEPFMTIN